MAQKNKIKARINSFFYRVHKVQERFKIILGRNIMRLDLLNKFFDAE
jgi:hypothetical protein